MPTFSRYFVWFLSNNVLIYSQSNISQPDLPLRIKITDTPSFSYQKWYGSSLIPMQSTATNITALDSHFGCDTFYFPSLSWTVLCLSPQLSALPKKVPAVLLALSFLCLLTKLARRNHACNSVSACLTENCLWRSHTSLLPTPNQLFSVKLVRADEWYQPQSPG